MRSQIPLTVTNDSFRPISLKDVGCKYADGTRDEIIVNALSAVRGPQLPLVLQDGESAEWIFNAEDLCGPLARHRPIMQPSQQHLASAHRGGPRRGSGRSSRSTVGWSRAINGSLD